MGWVALAGTRQGSHGPGRAYINASGSSTDRFAVPEGTPRLSERVPWTGGGASMCPTCFPRPGLPAGASLPSPGSSGASSPASAVLSKRYDFLPPVPPRFVAFAWRYLGVHSFGSLPGGRVRRRDLELVTRYLRPGHRQGDGRISQVPGEPRLPVCPVQSTPAGPRAPDRYGAAAWPLVCEKQRLPRKVFRRSIAGLSDSLSTLRRSGCPAPTQDSLPAVGQTLLGGRSTRRVPTKGFRGVFVTSLPPFPSLLGAITSTAAAKVLAGHGLGGCVQPVFLPPKPLLDRARQNPGHVHQDELSAAR